MCKVVICAESTFVMTSPPDFSAGEQNSTDQPPQIHSPVNTFVVVSLNDYIITLLATVYSETCLKRPLMKNRQNKGLIAICHLLS